MWHVHVRVQGDRLCVAVFELACLVLRMDPASNPQVTPSYPHLSLPQVIHRYSCSHLPSAE